MTKRYLVTGGAGFIGSAVVRHLIKQTDNKVLVVDKLTYAGNLESLEPVSSNRRFAFNRADINDTDALRKIFTDFSPDVVMHLAAESHVDRSIDGPAEFIRTNIVGTFSLLQVALAHWRALTVEKKKTFDFIISRPMRFLVRSGPTGLFREETRYQPRSPYSASKAASDHLVLAWHHTYGLPVVMTNCSNNYGPYHFPEKLIPLTIINALEGKALPVYGTGENIRDWLHVDDHAEALLLVVDRAQSGETYNIGGHNEQTNLDVVRKICDVLDELCADASIGHRSNLIKFVGDRPGHDARYAIDASKICRDLGWRPRYSFESGLRHTVQWYLNNKPWWQRLRAGIYGGERLGLGA